MQDYILEIDLNIFSKAGRFITPSDIILDQMLVCWQHSGAFFWNYFARFSSAAE